MNEKQLEICMRFIDQAKKDKEFAHFLEKKYQLTEEEATHLTLLLYRSLLQEMN